MHFFLWWLWLVEILCYWENWGNIFLSEPLWQKHQHHGVVTYQNKPPVGTKGWHLDAWPQCFLPWNVVFGVSQSHSDSCYLNTIPVPPQHSVQLIHWAWAHIPTIHFPWRLSFHPCLSHSPRHSLRSFFSLCACPPLFQSGADRNSAANISTRSQCSGSKHLK